MFLVDKFILKNLDNENYHEHWLTRDFHKKLFLRQTETKFDTFIARGDVDVFGYIIGSPTGTKVYEIRQHYVSEEYQGRHIGRRLKSTLTDYVKKQGYWAIISDVQRDNTKSVKLNQSSGWSVLTLDEETYRFYKILR